MKKYYTTVVDLNKAKCLRCGDIIESKHRHDFRECRCGNLFVDGGKDYIRIGCEDLSLYEDMSVTHQVERKPYEWEK